MKKADIKTDLIEQLERNGVCGNHYTDLINDYMDMWDIKIALIKDIKDRGVTCEYKNGANQFGYKKNDSVSELVKVNTQMLKILNDLGLKAARFEPAVEDDEM